MTHNLLGLAMMLIGAVTGVAALVLDRAGDEDSDTLALIVLLGGAIVMFAAGILAVFLF